MANMLELMWKICFSAVFCIITYIMMERICELEQKVEILSKVAFISVLQNASSAEAK